MNNSTDTSREFTQPPSSIDAAPKRKTNMDDRAARARSAIEDDGYGKLSFLELPAEIRKMIYEECFRDVHVLLQPFCQPETFRFDLIEYVDQYGKWPDGLYTTSKYQAWSLFLVSREVSQNARAAFLNTAVILYDASLPTWIPFYKIDQLTMATPRPSKFNTLYPSSISLSHARKVYIKAIDGTCIFQDQLLEFVYKYFPFLDQLTIFMNLTNILATGILQAVTTVAKTLYQILNLRKFRLVYVPHFSEEEQFTRAGHLASKRLELKTLLGPFCDALREYADTKVKPPTSGQTSWGKMKMTFFHVWEFELFLIRAFRDRLRAGDHLERGFLSHPSLWISLAETSMDNFRSRFPETAESILIGSLTIREEDKEEHWYRFPEDTV